MFSFCIFRYINNCMSTEYIKEFSRNFNNNFCFYLIEIGTVVYVKSGNKHTRKHALRFTNRNLTLFRSWGGEELNLFYIFLRLHD